MTGPNLQPTNAVNGEAPCGRARTRTDSAFQSTGSVIIGPSTRFPPSPLYRYPGHGNVLSPKVPVFENRFKYPGNGVAYSPSVYAPTPFSPIPYSPVNSRGSLSGLTPTLGNFNTFGARVSLSAPDGRMVEGNVYPVSNQQAARNSNSPVAVNQNFRNYTNIVPASQSNHGSGGRVDGLPDIEMLDFSLQTHHGTQVAHGNVLFDSYWDRRQDNIQPYYPQPSISAPQPQPIAAPSYTQGSERQIQQVLYPTYPPTPHLSVSEEARSCSNGITRPKLPPINIDAANARAVNPTTPQSTTSEEPEISIRSSPSSDINFRNPFDENVSSGEGTPDTVVSPHDQVAYIPLTAIAPQGVDVENVALLQAAIRAQKTSIVPLTPRTPRTPKDFSRPLNDEEKDFILYLSLQGCRGDAVGVELGRLTGLFGQPHASIDAKGRKIGIQVVEFLSSFAAAKGTEEEAEKIATKLIARSEREGWHQGPLLRARGYSVSIKRGKSMSSDLKSRRYEAKCRGAYKKWFVNNVDVLPCEDGRKLEERMAFQGMLLEGTAQEADDSDQNEIKKRLLELWESGTIAGKALG